MACGWTRWPRCYRKFTARRQWLPNEHGGSENLRPRALVNHRVQAGAGAPLFAEESSASWRVTRAVRRRPGLWLEVNMG